MRDRAPLWDEAPARRVRADLPRHRKPRSWPWSAASNRAGEGCGRT